MGTMLLVRALFSTVTDCLLTVGFYLEYIQYQHNYLVTIKLTGILESAV